MVTNPPAPCATWPSADTPLPTGDVIGFSGASGLPAAPRSLTVCPAFTSVTPVERTTSPELCTVVPTGSGVEPILPSPLLMPPPSVWTVLPAEVTVAPRSFCAAVPPTMGTDAVPMVVPRSLTVLPVCVTTLPPLLATLPTGTAPGLLLAFDDGVVSPFGLPPEAQPASASTASAAAASSVRDDADDEAEEVWSGV